MIIKITSRRYLPSVAQHDFQTSPCLCAIVISVSHNNREQVTRLHQWHVIIFPLVVLLRPRSLSPCAFASLSSAVVFPERVHITHAYVRFNPRDEFVHGDVNGPHLRLFHQPLISVQVMRLIVIICPRFQALLRCSDGGYCWISVLKWM